MSQPLSDQESSPTAQPRQNRLAETASDRAVAGDRGWVFTVLLAAALLVTAFGVRAGLLTAGSALILVWLPLFSGTAIALQIVAAHCVERWAKGASEGRAVPDDRRPRASGR